MASGSLRSDLRAVANRPSANAKTGGDVRFVSANCSPSTYLPTNLAKGGYKLTYRVFARSGVPKLSLEVDFVAIVPTLAAL
jgi:hypothetical protein